MFAALQYHSTDYLYESMARQKFSIWRLSLCFPTCLHQDEKYHLTGLFADDKYRKPWTRIPPTENTISISVLDQWKKSLPVEDLLEKKPISTAEFPVSKELMQVVPSSNPCSQTDTEEPFLLTNSIFKDKSTQDKHLKINYATEFKEQWQDLFMEEELVFIDNLEKFREKVPTTSILVSRLHFFLVKDPLLESEGQKLTEENLFRECLTFQNEMEMEEPKKELQGIKENFCTVDIKDEEHFMLPVELEFCKPSNGKSDSVKIPSHLELKELLNLAPEDMADEDMCKEVTKEDLKAEITYQLEIYEDCPMPHKVCSTDSRSMLEICESVKHVPYLKDELEVPLTPPCRQERSWANFLCTELPKEPVHLSGNNSIWITESSKEYLECFLWQSEKYRDKMSSLLLVEHETFQLAHQHQSLAELKEMLAVEEEEPMLSPLEEGWWLHLDLYPASVETLEQLNMDGSNANSLLPLEEETFSSCQLERLLEENNSMTNYKLLSAERHQLNKVINPNMSMQNQKQHFTLKLSAASSAEIHSTNTSMKQLTEGSIKKNKVEEAVSFLNQEMETPKSSEPVSCKDVGSEQDHSPSSQKPGSFALAAKWNNDDSDLSNFIMLRSKHTLNQTDEQNNVDSPEKVQQPEEQHTPVHKEDSSACETAITEKKEQESEINVIVNIQASESQCQAYCLLKEAATPVLKDLAHLGVLGSVHWTFDNIKFDHTRFFLKQQEKVICNNVKEGKMDEKEVVLFRHAALVHLLVTVRDLLLKCDLDTALGYLSKAKDIYKNILESCLNNIWKQLKIVQFSNQKKQETNPKITELQCKILNWMQSCREEHNVKILIITRMDSEREKAALIHTLSGVEGLKAMDLNSEKNGTSLGFKDIISNLRRYSCIVVHNQQIGADFPWTHFSLVVEYDYSENSCWKSLCKNLNITYMTFKTTIPERTEMGNHCGALLLEVQIPYVFLATEGLLNMPDILQLLESKYSITFVERNCSYSLRLLGSTGHYAVLTVDECTAIFLQSLEELNHDQACDSVISTLTALSLQYLRCWIVFYSRERMSLQYSLRGDTLLNLVLIYATLIELKQKSEDFEVKVVLMPGIEETAVLIRQIADNILIASDISPQEWLDKSWLSLLPSETEKCLLTFPCINPLVAQLMLKNGSSVNRLFLASFDQLQEMLPEVPKKVLKHFSDITSSYNLSAAAPLETAVKCASSPGDWSNFNTFCPDYKQNHQSLEQLGISQMNLKVRNPPLNHHQKGFFHSGLPRCMQKKSCSSEVITRRNQNDLAVPKGCEGFAHLEVRDSLNTQRQPLRMQYGSDHPSNNSEKEDFFATFSGYATQESSKNFLEGFRDTTFKSPEILIDETPWNDSSSTVPCDSFASDAFLSEFFVDPDELQSQNFYQTGRESKGKRKPSPRFLWMKENRTGFAEVPDLKKKKLTYERDPGRSDGQTRLKFF